MRITHVSDLHFGHHDPALAENLAADIEAQNPDLVVVSGDFTQLGTRDEFDEARAFLDRLTTPVFAVPGNHDVPAFNFLRRLVDPYGHYRRFIAHDLEPFVEIDGVAIAGLRTVRRIRAGLNWAEGTISRRQLKRLAATFENTSLDAVRIVVAHHPLLMPEGPMQKKMQRVDEADRALAAFADIGVRVVLSGHFHLSYVRRYEQPGTLREGMPPGPREAAHAPILVVQASSTISSRLGGEPNAYKILDIGGGKIDIAVREWLPAGWTTREQTAAAA